MKDMTVEQAEFWLHKVLLASLKNEHRTTKKVIEAIPLDKGDYRPDAISKTALELAWHIVAAENRFHETVINGAFDSSARPRPDSVKNSADMAAFYTNAFEKNFAAISKMTGQPLIKVVDFRGLFQLPAVGFAQLGMNHSIHHRGQLTMYLRPMGAKVPSIYGESYDDAQARKAAQG
jgi:uncharacterized damage-inducible protein DinB